MEKQSSTKISYDTVRATKAYKSMSPIQQNLLRKDSLRLIDNGVNISSTRGYEYWEKVFHPSYHIKEIVKELCHEHTT